MTEAELSAILLRYLLGGVFVGCILFGIFIGVRYYRNNKDDDQRLVRAILMAFVVFLLTFEGLILSMPFFTEVFEIPYNP